MSVTADNERHWSVWVEWKGKEIRNLLVKIEQEEETYIDDPF